MDQSEIQQHLEELNLTTLVKERMKRLGWFYEHKIPVVQIETTFYLVPENIDSREFVRRFTELNIQLRFLQLRLNWFKEMGLSLSLKDVLGTQKYEFNGSKPNFDPSKRLQYVEHPYDFWCIPDQHRDNQIKMLYDYITILQKSNGVDLGNTENRDENKGEEIKKDE